MEAFQGNIQLMSESWALGQVFIIMAIKIRSSFHTEKQHQSSDLHLSLGTLEKKKLLSSEFLSAWRNTAKADWIIFKIFLRFFNQVPGLFRSFVYKAEQVNLLA